MSEIEKKFYVLRSVSGKENRVKEFIEAEIKNGDLKEYISHYNVNEKDPEMMEKYRNFNTTSQFHVDYLRRLLREKNILYTKINPSDTAESYYLEQLIKRVEETDDLKSFKSFLELIGKFS